MANIKAEQVAAVAAADLADELTVVKNVLSRALLTDAPSRADLVDAMAAVQRAEWCVAQTATWARRSGAVPYAWTLDRLLNG